MSKLQNKSYLIKSSPKLLKFWAQKWHKIGLFLIFAILIDFSQGFTNLAIANDDVKSVKSSPRHILDSNGRENPNLVETDLTELFTTELSSVVIPSNRAGSLILFAGVGAKSKNYGIGATMTPIANSVLKLNILPYAFQNPLYFEDDNDDQTREIMIGHFKNAQNQLEWMAASVRSVIAKTPAGERIVVAGRSTGAALLLELLHRYIKSGEYADIFQKVDDLLIMGAVDHRPDQFKKWYEREKAWLDGQEQIFDRYAYSCEVEMFRGFHYASDFVNASARKVPTINYIIGARDQMLTIKDQLDLSRQVQRTLGGVSFNVMISDTAHNPAASIAIEKDGKRIMIAKSMERLKPILSQIYSTPVGSQKPGYHLTVRPEAVEFVNECGILLE
jgi:hypothetical protein